MRFASSKPINLYKFDNSDSCASYSFVPLELKNFKFIFESYQYDVCRILNYPFPIILSNSVP